MTYTKDALKEAIQQKLRLNYGCTEKQATDGEIMKACALALRDGFLPATIHYQTPDPACDLDVVPNEGRPADIRYALSNSLGFGGHNACLAFKKWEG